TPSTTHIYTLSLHDALPIYQQAMPEKRVHLGGRDAVVPALGWYEARGGHAERSEDVVGEHLVEGPPGDVLHDLHQHDCAQVVERSEEHTSELQSRSDLVCRL